MRAAAEERKELVAESLEEVGDVEMKIDERCHPLDRISDPRTGIPIN